MQRRLAREEGIFCEPAGAVSVVGALAAAAGGEIQTDEVCVCLVTGSGFKDLASVEQFASSAACPTVDWQQLGECFAA
jgi:threonine synthase